MKVYDSLNKVVKFAVSELRSSKLPLEDRTRILKSTRHGRLLSFLYPFGFVGGMVFVAGAVARPVSTTVFRSLVLEDHASKVVRNSLNRAFGSVLENEFRRIKPPRAAVLRSFIRNLKVMRRAYKSGDLHHFTEFGRVLSLFFFYIVWTALFSRASPKAALFARTNDVKRLALGAAAEEYGIPVVTFTVDRVALRNPAPFEVDTVLSWTRRQRTAAEKEGSRGIQMPVPSIRSMKLPVPENDKGSYGLLLNAKCDTEKLGIWIRSFYSKHPDGMPLQVRPHPGFDTERLKDLPYSEICDWHQPLGEYLDTLDMAFALNTNAVIEALLHGIPVVYLGGLDPYEYDLHRFVADGLVYPYGSEDIFPQAVNEFYSSDAFRSQWNPDEFVTDGTKEREFLLQLTSHKG
ncbi:hypothetical protein [Marispirochaeta aestuarii]|uniref:hypothetical protein n=1 Tax=Marispirochaeta aestuarii TaxID=1963862 RepID=UPI002ABEA08E|nr:hypothetical protein [Marispirochaeta aestuarii]